MSVLVLNGDGRVQRVTKGWRRALELVYAGKATMLEPSGQVVRAGNQTFDIPSVIMLKTYYNVPKRGNKRGKGPKWSKQMVFERDNWQCQYCGLDLVANHGAPNRATIDHIHPRALGGKSTFTNTCAACVTCQQRKANKRLEDVYDRDGKRMKFFNPNFTPKLPTTSYMVFSTRIRPEWRIYLEV